MTDGLWAHHGKDSQKPAGPLKVATACNPVPERHWWLSRQKKRSLWTPCWPLLAPVVLCIVLQNESSPHLSVENPIWAHRTLPPTCGSQSNKDAYGLG